MGAWMLPMSLTLIIFNKFVTFKRVAIVFSYLLLNWMI